MNSDPHLSRPVRQAPPLPLLLPSAQRAVGAVRADEAGGREDEGDIETKGEGMIAQANSIRIPLADNSVHMGITSVPYWGLRSYLPDDHPLKPLELGLEPTPAAYLANMVAVFREIWRVLRPDGTFWLNVGDSYATAPNGRSAAATKAAGNDDRTFRDKPFNTAVGGLKPKDLCGIPWRLAFALQDDGWYLRSDIIWAKPNPMPESVEDRPTKAHEYLFLLAKSERYFYDAEAIREAGSGSEYDLTQRQPGRMNGTRYLLEGKGQEKTGPGFGIGSIARNKRTVWEIATQSYSGAHYATFPTKLAEPCVLAGTSARGVCPKCGKPWRRVVEREHIGDNSRIRGNNRNGTGKNKNHFLALPPAGAGSAPRLTTGWRPSCSCIQKRYPGIPLSGGTWLTLADEIAAEFAPVPAVVFDPFCGSGTVGEVARELGRRFVGLDLNPVYLAINALPRSEGKTSAAAIAQLPMFASEG